MNMWGRGMNIYKERKNSRAKYERENDRYATPVNEKKGNVSDTVEYTNMSSYERYRRDKLDSAQRNSQYNPASNNMRTFDEPYRARNNYNENYSRAPRRNENRYDDYIRYDDSIRNDDRYFNSAYGEPRNYDRDIYREETRYDRRGGYDYYEPRQEDNYYESRRNERDNYPRSSKKKSGMTLKCKFMILVYFAIIAVITTLILINAVPNAKADSSYNEQPEVEISDEMLNRTKDGENLNKVDYVYDANSGTIRG